MTVGSWKLPKTTTTMFLNPSFRNKRLATRPTRNTMTVHRAELVCVNCGRDSYGVLCLRCKEPDTRIEKESTLRFMSVVEAVLGVAMLAFAAIVVLWSVYKTFHN